MKIKASLALFLDNQVHNFARKLAFDLNNKFNTGLIAARLPQHISLGPGFEIDVSELEQVGECLGQVVRDTNPLQIEFEKISLKIVPGDNDGLGIIWMDVRESNELQELHDRIYSKINDYGWKVDWQPGKRYLFHSTISYGGQPGSKYLEIYNVIPEKKIQLQSTIKQIGVCCPPDGTNTPGTFVTYKIYQFGS